MLDYKIVNARVVDGTGSPWFRADVGIKDDKIVKIGSHIDVESSYVIDAKDAILSPGFVDVHSHDDIAVLDHPVHHAKTFQGVTSEVLANCGLGCAPIHPSRKLDLMKYVIPVLGKGTGEWHWSKFREYTDVLFQCKTSLNLVTQVAHGAVRISVMGYEARPATAGEVEEMKSLIEEAMQAGAIGMSIGLLYAPGCYADHRELVELSKVVSRYGGILNCHLRAEGDSLLDSLHEVFAVAEEAEVKIHISHLKWIGMKNWGKMDQALELIDAKRAKGLDVTCDIYPYTAGSSTLMSVLPSWVLEGGTEQALLRLADDSCRKRIKADMARSYRGWDNFISMLGWERVYVSAVGSEGNRDLEGLHFNQIAEKRSQEPCESLMDVLLEEKGNVTMILHQMSEEDIKSVLCSECSVIGSDGLPLPSEKVHPRQFGTFPRVLSKYVREEKVMSLEQAIRKMTSFPARRFGLKNRGLLMEGMMADLVLFDDKTVRDLATFDYPRRFPEGIAHVMVNGKPVAKDGHETGQSSGIYIPFRR